MVTDILRMLCDQKECAVECLYNSTVTEALLQPIHNLMKGTAVSPNKEEEVLQWLVLVNSQGLCISDVVVIFSDKYFLHVVFGFLLLRIFIC